MDLEFEWDEKKNISNYKKHGIWFEEATSIFDDQLGRLFFDSNHSDNESRFILIGMNVFRKILVVVHAYRETEDKVRIISARPTTKRERGFYEEGI
ncbi:BrnT family toxin [Bdellovibrio bacteriovorus]|uniref:BrnT family toxin n=1 Tax=Bdellovibrio bacteriovorus TaxID=959 RepID=UPI0035A96C56